VSVILC